MDQKPSLHTGRVTINNTGTLRIITALKSKRISRLLLLQVVFSTHVWSIFYWFLHVEKQQLVAVATPLETCDSCTHLNNNRGEGGGGDGVFLMLV